MPGRSARSKARAFEASPPRSSIRGQTRPARFATAGMGSRACTLCRRLFSIQAQPLARGFWGPGPEPRHRAGAGGRGPRRRHRRPTRPQVSLAERGAASPSLPGPPPPPFSPPPVLFTPALDNADSRASPPDSDSAPLQRQAGGGGSTSARCQ
jgi:hypothetical protein